MDLSSRYEILDTIASGDFATVLRARDRELGREVAIKQIHQQFLTDQEQLARYWREAQLLASLQHPNILTIYDVVRPRGWLILELMQGSLEERAGGEPLDLDSLRIILAAGLNALHFLHTNGVIHGDVKPGNLLFDAQNRIKLGDFGLARRATSNEGSLLKGTTKYMAPELVSDQFGAVGPASDLYSLGFSAFELMCGSQFDSLFPGLATFGRDKQIAWMMWHAAADRNLPEIGRVLEGVPDDLARVIQKLVAKDQARRYGSAQEVLRELTAGPPVAEQVPDEEEAAAAAASAGAARKKRRLRLAALSALLLSAIVCAAILFWPGGRQPPRMPRGVITRVFPDEWKLALNDNGKTRKISFARHDRFFVNGEPARLQDLQRDDQVVVERIRDEALGRWVTEIYVTRPKTYTGPIKEIRAGEGSFTLTLGKGDDPHEDLIVEVSDELPILLNPGCDQRSVTCADLQPEDGVEVRHVAADKGRVATKLTVRRKEELKGTVAGRFSESKNQLTVTVTREGQVKLLYLPVAGECQVTINRRRLLNQRALTVADLREGDQATIVHDTQVGRVDARRILHESGEIRAVHHDPANPGAGRFDLEPASIAENGADAPVTCRLAPQCEITLGGEPVELADLRKGDKVEIDHGSLDGKDPEVTRIAADRPADPSRWAILIGIQDYGDPSLSRLTHPVGDATLLRDTLVGRYAVPDKQALLLKDDGLSRLKGKILQQLSQVDSDDTLLVYVASHAYQDEQGRIQLAPKDFQLARIGSTGLELQWLVDELEKCAAGEKLLLLDCSHAGKGNDLRMQPSTAEMLATLKGPPGWAPLRTVAALASCGTGQRGVVWADKGHGLFAWCLARGYAGGADKDRDNQIDSAELSAFLRRQMASAAGQLQAAQTPTLIEADNRPPRLGEEAKRKVRDLARLLQGEKVDFDAVDEHFAAAAQSAAAEPEPRLLYGLLLLKGRRREAARQQFAELKVEHPNWLIPLQGTAWAWFGERNHTAGVSELRGLVSNIPKPRSTTGQYPEYVRKLFIWTGRLRQFAEIVDERSPRLPPRSLAELDAAVKAHGSTAQGLYDQGRQESRDRKEQIEKEAEDARKAGNLATATQRLTVARYLLHSYLVFPFDDALKQVAGGLDRRVPQY